MSTPRKLIDIYPPKKKPSFKTPAFLEQARPSIPGKKEPVLAQKKERRGGIKRKLFLFVVLSLLFVAGLSHFVFQKVEVVLWPETEIFSFEEKINIDPQAKTMDLAQKVLSGQVFDEEKSVSGEFSSTEKITKESYAKGIIRVYNNYQSSQTMVAKTRFQPPLEKVLYFRATKKIIVAPKTYVDVEVIADAPGQEYNIEPATFSVPGLAGRPQYYSIYGKSFAPMTGGYLGEIKTVSEQDLLDAQEALLEQIEKETAASLKNKISQDYILAAGAVFQEIIEATGTLAGTETDKFTYRVKAKSKAIALKKAEVEKFVTAFIENKLQNTGKKIQPASLKIEYSDASLSKETGRLSLTLKISATTYKDINKQELEKSLTGKSLKEAQLAIEEMSDIVKFKIRAFPFWIKVIPAPPKVEIRLNID